MHVTDRKEDLRGSVYQLGSSLARPRTTHTPGRRPHSFSERRMDIVQLGYATGCKGCRAARAGGAQKTKETHCRERVMMELMKTEMGACVPTSRPMLAPEGSAETPGLTGSHCTSTRVTQAGPDGQRDDGDFAMRQDKRGESDRFRHGSTPRRQKATDGWRQDIGAIAARDRGRHGDWRHMESRGGSLGHGAQGYESGQSERSVDRRRTVGTSRCTARHRQVVVKGSASSPFLGCDEFFAWGQESRAPARQ